MVERDPTDEVEEWQGAIRKSSRSCEQAHKRRAIHEQIQLPTEREARLCFPRACYLIGSRLAFSIVNAGRLDLIVIRMQVFRGSRLRTT